jgi:hypothetical protein
MPPGERLAQLAAQAAGAPTPRAALRQLKELRRELDAFERRQVAEALAEGSSFAAIARELGLSRQSVHRRFRDLAVEHPLRTAPDARRVLQYAREEAAALGADELRGEHVLLAVLRARDLPAAVALRTEGVTLDRARARVEAMSPRGRLFRRAPSTEALREALAGPAREARARGSRRIEVEDLLLAALAEPDGGAARTLGALNVDPDLVRARLRALGEVRTAE